MSKIAVLFAGQGAQYQGMGRSFYELEDVRPFYETANEILGYELEDLIFTENSLLNQTQYTQPAILVTSIGIYETLKKVTNLKPQVVAGFSLGEYTALYASGVFNFEQIVNLVKRRAEAMEVCAKNVTGKMCAILGLDRHTLQKICSIVTEEIGLVAIANYNCPGQLVIGGMIDAVDEASQRALNAGAKRVVPLNVSGGFHTGLMENAAWDIYRYVQTIPHNTPEVPIIMNATSDYLDIKDLQKVMKLQIESSVYFEDSINRIRQDGVTKFIEIGPGNVLSGFVKKILRDAEVVSINTLEDLEKVKAWI